jgi:hypothetical protein
MAAKLTDKQVCLKAAKILEEEGWIQRALHNDGRGYCLIGALGKALGISNNRLDNEYLSVCSGRAGKIAEKLDNFADRQDAIEWNDSDSRRKQQVIALLKKGPKKGGGT